MSEQDFYRVNGEVLCFDCMKLELEHLGEGTFFDFLFQEGLKCERCERWQTEPGQ